METNITKNQEFIILSKKVTNATKCIVTEILNEEKINVELYTEEQYIPEEDVELFSTSGSGILYFISKIKEINGKNITVTFPEKTTLIQRRKYTRVEINKNILIYTEDKPPIRATVTDISAGGMSIISDTKMEIKTNYQIDLKLENNTSISCKFNPIRIKATENNKYKISGQFKLIKNIDRVALTQYCLKKVTELQNK